MSNFFIAQSLTLPGTTPGDTVIKGLITNGKLFEGGTLTIGSILSLAIPIVFLIAGIALLAMIVMGGFTFLTSAGDPKKMEQGKNQLTYAIVGFVIIFAAVWLVQIFGAMFGLPSMTQLFQ
jgi:hypothetical protein